MCAPREIVRGLARGALLALSLALPAQFAAAQKFAGPQIEVKVDHMHDRLEMVVNSSRILTLDEKIP